jgi:predicted nucleic-acid-binding protein
MIGLDTNVIIAWLVQGHRRTMPRTDGYRVSHVALMEYEWVLSRKLRFPKERVLKALNLLFTSADIHIDKPEVVRAAIQDYASGGADFADFMIMRDNERAGCTTTLTLDHDASRKRGFTHLRS